MTHEQRIEAADDIVGHKTIDTGEIGEDGFPKFRHEPLTRGEAEAIWDQSEKDRLRREEQMPDEESAIRALFDAWLRLKDFRWNDPSYCPKDGSSFNVIELGSTGIHTAHYSGEWPNGSWWLTDAFDVYPTRPAMFKLFPEDQAKRDAEMKEAGERVRAMLSAATQPGGDDA